MTELLYHKDSYIFECNVEIKNVEEKDGLFFIETDKTIFYPGGGGQPQDRGKIDGIEIIGAQYINDKLYHLLSLKPNRKKAVMSIDKKFRLQNTSLHTGQHLLSAVLIEKFSAETLSFAINEKGYASIEVDIRSIGFSEIKVLEDAVYEKIREGLSVKSYEIDCKEVGEIPLRKPPKSSGKVRIVEIEGYDFSPCGGTHLKNTSEISPFKIFKTDKVRKNVRLYFVSSFLAQDYIYSMWEREVLLKRSLGVEAEKIVDSVEEVLNDNIRVKKRLRKYIKDELKRLSEEVDSDFLFLNMDEYDIKDIKFLSSLLSKNGIPHFLYKQLDNDFYFILKRGRREDINLLEIKDKIFSIGNIKGGGTNEYIEGKGKAKDKIDEILNYIESVFFKE